MRVIASLTLSFFLICGWDSLARAEGNIEKGRETARKVCIVCHNVGEDGGFKKHPLSFAAIAVYRTDNQIRNRIFYPDVHSGMREHLGFVFSVDKIEDLVAYIRSLESGKSRNQTTK